MDRLTNGIDYCKMHCDFGKSNECFFQDKSKCYEKNIYEKLREYEDLEEQGLLLKLPCSRVYYIVDKGTKYATVMSKLIQDLCVFEIKGIDKDGYYWSTQAEAEQKLKEMESD